ncbi:hypothetical protein [Ramlibacter sp.]|uniref:hypothetical protein n=1 Tax=Ramlibacter sp. TaxID=1917967 RepID=UPI002CC2D6F8|nr:hypothetical protein [Ramlibacter sp.]HWI83030.1 hypothetical protein [Ramlibacter sp.]
MAYSSIMGADAAPEQPSGRGADLLGPSDNSDSGSDTIGTHEAHADSDAVGTGERAAVGMDELEEGADIMPDRIVGAAAGDGGPQADAEGMELTDLDAADPLDDAGEDADSR